ncbi:MAG: 2-oxoglutarate oxidoreductase [Kiritimatiellae bacterium]|nr:2-oxoglutarate oxidoreductase [Kiritimatiellia bacterium]
MHAVIRRGRKRSARAEGPGGARAPRKVYARPAALTDVQTHYCPGCGHGIVHKVIAETMDALHITDRCVGIAPVGCAVLAYFYFACDVTEAAHGRGPAVATGIKRARPDTIVFSYQGDGDLAAIGTAETIHAANRGENITVVFVNNSVYGMTGGQMAPTTLPGQKTATCPAGRDPDDVGTPIRMCELINTLDRPYHIERVALDSPQGVRSLRRALRAAFGAQVEGRGYSFVEVLSACPTYQRLSPARALKFVGEKMAAHFPVRVFRREGKCVDA